MNPEDIERKEFPTSLRGYDREQVDSFLHDVAIEVRRLRAALERQAAETQVTSPAPPEPAAPPEPPVADAYRHVGEETARILLAAEQSAREIRDRAQREAAEILADAREQAKTIARSAIADREGVEQDIRQLQEARALLATEMEDLHRRFEELVLRFRTPFEVRRSKAKPAEPKPPADEAWAPEAPAEAPPPAGDGEPVAVPTAPVTASAEAAPTQAAADPSSRAPEPTAAELLATAAAAAAPAAASVSSASSASEAPAAAPPVHEWHDGEESVVVLPKEAQRADTPAADVRVGPAAPPAPVVPGGNGGFFSASPVPAEEAAGALPSPPTEPAAALAWRATALGDLPGDAAKLLKRLLQEDQNDLLERLRGWRGVGPAAAHVPPPDRHAARFAEGLRDALGTAYRAGRRAGGSAEPGDPTPIVNTLVTRQLVTPLRRDLLRLIEPPPGWDTSATAASKRASDVYRVWKGVRTDLLGEGLVYAVFHQGLVQAVKEDAQRRNSAPSKEWVPAADERNCPREVCRTNADAGPVAIDAPFTSGHLVPPAHGGCTCTLLVRG